MSDDPVKRSGRGGYRPGADRPLKGKAVLNVFKATRVSVETSEQSGRVAEATGKSWSDWARDAIEIHLAGFMPLHQVLADRIKSGRVTVQHLAYMLAHADGTFTRLGLVGDEDSVELLLLRDRVLVEVPLLSDPD